MSSKDPEKRKQNWQAYYAKNKQQLNVASADRNKKLWQESPQKVLETQKKARTKNPEKYKEHARAYRERLKTQVFEAYGGSCACCGEPEWEFLAVDHVNNDGAAERKAYREIKKNTILAGGPLYRQILKLGFPATYQLLCHNCNWSKHRGGGLCIHKRKAIKE